MNRINHFYIIENVLYVIDELPLNCRHFDEFEVNTA